VTPPIFTATDLQPDALDVALREHGGFFVTLPNAGELPERILEASRSFFLLSPEEKEALAIEGSSHFRGWSQMRNERDWREQLHLGRERCSAGDDPAFHRLEGPNLWPADASWREVISRYIEVAAHLGELFLHRIASCLGVDPTGFGHIANEGYIVAKLIGYHPQPSAATIRSGVAAHVDFSWLTINLQDSEGLEVRRPDGAWTSVAVRKGSVWVHAGELLEHATRGRYAATPHQVHNPSSTRTRVSIPVFVNPPLDGWVRVLEALSPEVLAKDMSHGSEGDHVHRVLDPHPRREAFHFGHAEWRRKGLGVWCFACCPSS